jgi:hypothetical protein
MTTYVVEYLTTNRHGGLVDKSAKVRAASPEAAAAIIQSRNPNAAIGWVGEA